MPLMSLYAAKKFARIGADVNGESVAGTEGSIVLVILPDPILGQNPMLD